MKPFVALHLGAALGLAVAVGCGASVTPAQEAAIEKGTCVAIDDVAGALGGPAAEGLVTIACDAVGSWVLTQLPEAGAPAPAPTMAAPAPLQVRRVHRRACVAAGICQPRAAHTPIADAGDGG